jgi:hypothetical protein
MGMNAGMGVIRLARIRCKKSNSGGAWRKDADKHRRSQRR